MPDSKRLSSSSSRRTKAKSGLLRFLDDQVLDPDFVGAMAGDRELTEKDKELLADLKNRRGNKLYCDLLFSITQQYFPTEQARDLWDHILKHKYELSAKLGRNVKVAVAALDYLSNITELLKKPMLISGPSMATVAEVALKDGMTRLYDHTTFISKLESEIQRYERYGNMISVIMLDVDQFKAYNDTYGHPEGDRVLRELGRIIRREVRDVDVPARYGGEEFIIMLPRTSPDEAYAIAERIRSMVQKRFAGHGDLTVSLGVAECPRHATTAAALIDAADKALYLSKHNGRNQTTLAQA